MSITRTQPELTERQIHDVLRNNRRRKVLQQLQRNLGTLTVRELSETIAEAETGQSPPPRNIRDSVYNSLNQTHLPKLDGLGVLEYDQHRKTVSVEPGVRQVSLYTEILTPYGITWAEFYQLLLLAALLAIAAIEVGLPVLSTLSPLWVSSAFLVVFAGSIAYRLWSRRWIYLQRLLS